jgi:hypothetical protein
MNNRMTGKSSYLNDIVPLFRPGDIQCMKNQGIDLEDWVACSEVADRILKAVSAGFMPPDQPWTADKIQVFSSWIDEGSPKRSGNDYAAFFRSIDARTEYSTDPATDVMPSAQIVMNRILPAWRNYAKLASTPSGALAKQAVQAALAVPANRAAVLAVDKLLCDCLEASFGALPNTDSLAALDAYEQFGRDRLPLDQARAASAGPRHPAGEPLHHRMDSTSMWFNWAGQLDLSVMLLGAADARHSLRVTMAAGLSVGCPMDFLFRDPASRSAGDKHQPGTRPEYKADDATADLVRTKGRLFLNDYNAAAAELQQLYVFWANS